MANIYPPNFMIIVAEIDILMHKFSHTKKDIGYWYRRTFTNGQRVDLIDYRKKDIYIFRVGRGAWLVRQYPLLYGLFDEVLTVIAKLRITTITTLHEKHIIWLLELLDQAPAWIWAFD